MAEIQLTVEENDAAIDMEIEEAQEVEVLETDHSRLTNRDAADQHPEEAITGLVEDLKAHDEAIASLEKNKMRLMTAAETEAILNAQQ